jgi:hypothetical protein
MSYLPRRAGPPSALIADVHTHGAITLVDGGVTLVLYPDAEHVVDALRRRRAPRLLLVAPASSPPEAADPFEDWVRLPVDPVELDVRADLLARRADASRRAGHVVVDEDGVARREGVTALLTPVEMALFAVLLEREGSIVSQRDLEEVAAFAGSTMRLATRMARLRSRVTPLGVHVHTVRGRGYLLETVALPEEGFTPTRRF